MPVAIDTETNITDVYNQRYCMGISFATGTDDGIQTFYIPIRHDSWMAPGATNLDPPPTLLRGIQTELVFHNAKFDLHVLRRLGIQIPECKIYDTMLMSHLIYEERFSHSLEALCSDYLGVHKEKDLAKTMKAGEWESMPAFAMAKYAEKDTELTYNLYMTLKPFFVPYEEVWDTDEKFMLVLQQMEQRGILLDVERCATLKLETEHELLLMREKLGFDPAKPSQLHKKLFVELGLPVTSKTPGGKPQVNTKFLETCGHPIAKDILRYKELAKQLSSYYNSYLNLTGVGYNRIHPSFKQHGTVTGRLSCADPNMQQIPRDSPIKGLFLPEPGYELWEIDYKNIEMRLAMVYAGEIEMIELFANEGDVHQQTADALGVSRQFAKIINFLIIYGGTEYALAFQLGIPVKEAKVILTKYKKEYSRLFEKMDECQRLAEDTGSIRQWSGRYRHFKWKGDCKKAFNAIVQGGSFEIVKRSMLTLHARGFDIRNQVHDSVWVMIPEGDTKKIEEAEHIMADWTEEAFGLRFSVESKRLA